MRFVLAVLAAAAAALAAPAPAPAKDGVRAQLSAPLPADAKPGSRVSVAWTLEDAQGRPFGASGIFIRLLGAPGTKPSVAELEGRGSFRTEVEVPAGGIRRVEIGLRGWRSTGHGPKEPADMIFPIDGPVLAAAPADGGDEDGPPPLLLPLGAALAAIGAVALARRYRSPRRAARGAV